MKIGDKVIYDDQFGGQLLSVATITDEFGNNLFEITTPAGNIFGIHAESILGFRTSIEENE